MNPVNQNTRRNARSQTRFPKGSLVIELTVGSFFLSIFAIIAFHVGLLIFGAFMNDTACRDAARAAAQGNSQAKATTLAQAILISHKQTNSYLGSPALQTPIVYQDYNGSPPNTQTSPYIQLTTKTQVTLPIRFFSFLSQMFTSDQNLTFTATYTFPIVKVK
jgi:Flp pilus assembly protein TadG